MDGLDFKATHVIVVEQLDGTERRIPTHAHVVEDDPACEGGLVLYTRTEWDAAEPADWELCAEHGLTFQGRPAARGYPCKSVRWEVVS